MSHIRTAPTVEYGHGGNIHALMKSLNSNEDFFDFSANINPLGPPAWLRSVISRELSQVVHYPDPAASSFITAISEDRNIPCSQIIAGNGTTELLHIIPRVISCKRAVIPVPSYIDYIRVFQLNNIPITTISLQEKNDFKLDLQQLADQLREDDVVVLGSPNNPTGSVLDSALLLELAKNNPSTCFVVDEAFLDFVENGISLSGSSENIITLNSLTKFYALPGIRIGYCVVPEKLSAPFSSFVPPWTVNSLAQAVGMRLFTDVHYKKLSIENVKKRNQDLFADLNSIQKLKVFPSPVNFFLIKLKKTLTADELEQKLLSENIAIRNCSNYRGLDNRFFRAAVRTEEENEVLVEKLKAIFSAKNSKSRKQKTTPSLMIQGTSSNAGKSVLVAALCRIMIQDGLRVAPFKAQNMSLNSFVTHEGLEMGRAQVVQAQAAKLDPDVRMNPVLLKPNSDIGSQVIVHGKPVGNMTVLEYVKYKNIAGQEAKKSYDLLASEYDAIVLEGAGSPGEVNLKSHDIVNMQMAQYAKSPVLLVGDIDRGGVYASFIGTCEVMEEWERKLIKGFLVNRFRGDSSLLKSAHQFVYNHTGIPVVGTINYISDLGLPEEDSVSFKEGNLQKNRPPQSHVEIALISLPHVSNFTDVEPFLNEPDVFINIVTTVDQLQNPDCVIIPGSKNVMGDLAFIKESGFDQKIKELAENGCSIVGICGGYQILGQHIKDPYSIESSSENVSGLHLLPISTLLEKEKTLRRQQGKHLISGKEVYGYEIHHGISEGNAKPLLQFDNQATCGTIHKRMNIWGAYLHGIFDGDSFRRWFIDDLRIRKGLKPVGAILSAYDLETSFDKLAETVRESIDMDFLYNLMKI